MAIRKAAIAVVLAAAFAALLLGDVQRWLSLDALRHAHAGLDAAVQARPFLAAAAYFALYVVAAALSVPGAAVITLAGGALFGLAWGTVLVSFASSLGALLAFWAARFLVRDAVRARFGPRIADMDRGLERDGPLYLASLRLVPLVPFFVVNLALGVTRMRARTFYWVSQLAMLPGTVVYVNAGTQLSQLESLRGILGGGVLASFALLALLPWLGRGLAGALQRRKVYAAWRAVRPRRYDRNLVVIGGGAAGLVSAYVAAAARASVTLVEARRLGGDCLYTGCVPSKALLRSAKLAHQMRHARRLGLADTEPVFDFRAVIARVLDVITAIEPHDSVERYTALGVDVAIGHARLVDPWRVEITAADGSRRQLTTRAIVIAAGADPVVPPLPGLGEAGFLTSDTLWDALAGMDRAPARLVVLGGGPVGCELAQAMARLGSAVTQVEMAPRLLAREDDAASTAVHAALQDDGVRVLTGHQALRCETGDGGKVLVTRHGGTEHRHAFDVLLCAVGRRPRLSGYGLEALGLPTQRTVDTDASLRTLMPHILAAGDVAGPWQFTHTAAHQAWYASMNALFGHVLRLKVDDRVIPAVTFTDPEVARVGLNEREAREQGIAFEVTHYGLEDLDRALTDGEASGFVKVLTVPGRDRILGATIVGAHAGEQLAEFVLAMKHGLGLGKILGTVHAYPTFAEANKLAAGAWRRAHAPEGLLRLVHRYHAWRRG